jgi:hypothetical protein
VNGVNSINPSKDHDHYWEFSTFVTHVRIVIYRL